MWLDVERRLLSQPKYWCKQCSTFVKDTKFERTQHEATAKHQGNLKRALRDLHRGNEREEREKQRAKAEVDRLNRIVPGPAALPNRLGPETTHRTTSATSAPQASLAERKRQLAQLADMGIAIPEEHRAEMAMVGDWKTVSVSTLPSGEDRDDKSSIPLSTGIRKRRHGEEEEEAGNDDRPEKRVWGSTTRQYPGTKHEADTDIDALLMGRTELKDPAKLPNLKSEDEDDGFGLSSVQGGPSELGESIKREELTEANTSSLKSTLNGDPAEGIVFKKRKSKSAKQP